MEIYINSTDVQRRVYLDVPVIPDNASIDVVVEQNGTNVHTFSVVNPSPDGYYVTLPFFLTQHDTDLVVKWAFTYTEEGVAHPYNYSTPVKVVTPILSTRDIRAIDENVFAEDAEVIRIEKAVRHIIQAYTGQEFGHFHGEMTVKGSGSAALFSPKRIIELQTVNGVVALSHYVVDPDGYVVRHYPWGVPPVKADYHGLHMHTGGVIHDPNNVRWAYWSNRSYVLGGRFGWETVPEAVKEAAKLLVNDYACADSQYRDRYLTSMTAADWRIQFHSGAFVRTGNVRADQLLSDFVVTRGWGVI